MEYGATPSSLRGLARGQIEMSYFLWALPLWALILAVVIIPTSIAIGVQALVRRAVGVEKLALNNEVAGFIFAIIGVVYAVLLAFVVIAVWEKFSEGQTSVAKESAAAAALFYYSEGAEPEAAKLHASLVHYLTLVIESDWPAMASESEDGQTTDALGALYRAAMALNRTGTRSIPDMSEVFTQIDNPDLDQTRAPSFVHRACARDHLDHALWGRRFHCVLRAILRQSQCAGAPRDDRDSVDRPCGRSGCHHFPGPPVQRTGAHIAGSARTRARNCGTRIAHTLL